MKFKIESTTGTASTNGTFWRTGSTIAGVPVITSTTIAEEDYILVYDATNDAVKKVRQFVSPSCPYCGNASGKRDSRGNCASCGATV